MKLVSYLRVSSDSQAEHGLGLEIQERGNRAWAKTNGHRIVLTTRDEGISGTKDAADRPGLTEALNAVKEGTDGIVVARLDRLARALTIQEAVLAQVWRLGGSMFSVDVGAILRDDPDDPMRTFVRQVMGAAAQLDRAMVTSRMRAGRRLKAEKGGYACGGPPTGYRAENGTLVANDAPRFFDGTKVPSEAATVARIRELRAAGASLRGMATTLTVEGYRPKRGGPWHSAALGKIVGRAG
jgi:DNA invertase Pin-like site-specific DNA recombinase